MSESATAAAPTTSVHTVVVGAGQAGLSAGYHLARAGVPFVIVDAGDRVGGSWRQRWDSMRLFTPSSHDGLPGMRFPGPRSFPTRDAMTAYLEEYARRFELPVRLHTPVDGLFAEGDRFVVTSGATRIDADAVIVATGYHRRPVVPEFAADLSPEITQLHSRDYRNPDQLPTGTVLVVGAGNSGADIALDLAPSRPVLLAGRHPGNIPIDIEGSAARVVFPLLWYSWSHVLTERTPMGRRLRSKVLGRGDQLVRVKPADIDAAGVRRVPRITGVVGGRPRAEDGAVLDVAAVVWCTGFRPDHEWIDVPGLNSSGRLPTDRGAVTGVPGLYVLGQEFQFAFNSHTVGGVGRDAEHVVRRIERRWSGRPVADPTPVLS